MVIRKHFLSEAKQKVVLVIVLLTLLTGLVTALFPDKYTTAAATEPVSSSGSSLSQIPGTGDMTGGVSLNQLGVLALGVVLDRFLDQAQSVIRTAGAEARTTVVQAGQQAYNAIQTAKAAYADSLNLTIDKLDQFKTRTVQELQSVLDDLQKRTDDMARKVMSQSQQIINSLPFANTIPQLTDFSPNFVTGGSQPKPFELELQGNFVFAQRAELRPTLEYAGKTYQPMQNLTQSLKFQLTPSRTNNTSKVIDLMNVKITIPYEDGLLKTRKIATYNLIIGILPPVATNVDVYLKTIKPTKEVKHFVTSQWQQHSSNDDLEDVYTGPAHPGWTIIPNSVRFVVDWSQGDENDQWSKSLIGSSGQVAYRVKTVHHRFGTSGKVNFHFEYDLERTIQEETTIQRQHIVSQQWKQHSSDDDLDNSYSSAAPPPGWSIDTDSIRFVVDWSQGDQGDQWSVEQKKKTPVVTYQVRTVHHRFGTSGKVEFHFEYDIFRKVSNVEWKRYSLTNLGWGTSKNVPIGNSKEWQVIATTFDGQKHRFTIPSSQPYLKVQVQNNNLVMSVPSLSELRKVPTSPRITPTQN